MRKWVWILGVWACLTSVQAWAEDEQEGEFSTFDYKVITTKEGLSYRIPEDMPIETRNGVQAPIPFDEYIYGKFKTMEKRVGALETKIAALEKIAQSLKQEKTGASSPLLSGDKPATA